MNNLIRNFLNDSLVEMFCLWCKEWKNMSDEEIEALFMGVDGLEMNNNQFVCENVDDIDDEMIYDEVWCYVVEVCEEYEIPLEKLVSFLASRFYLYEYDKQDISYINYIKGTSLPELIKDFVDNSACGMHFIEAYLKTEADKEKYQDTRRMMKENNDEQPLISFEKFVTSGEVNLALYDGEYPNNDLGDEQDEEMDTTMINDGTYEGDLETEEYNSSNYIVKICLINQLLRDVICNLYNYYISTGCPDIEALNLTWNYFLKNFDPLGELDKMGFDSGSKEWYKHYMLSLIYADLYEDVTNTSIIQSDNYDDRLADVLPLVMVQLGTLSIPQEEGVRNRMLKHFILLQDEKEKMNSNRKKTYSDNRINVLKKINPMYFLDELNINK